MPVLESSGNTVVPDPTYNTVGWTAQLEFRDVNGTTKIPQDVSDRGRGTLKLNNINAT